MFDYLQQFNQLSKNLRDQVSSPSQMAIISELEGKYKVDLAATVMKVMVKSVAVKDLVEYLVAESGLMPAAANLLAQEMTDKIFQPVAEYLGLASTKRTLDIDKDAGIIIKEAGLILPSEILVGRFKNILATYLRGVRSKIDTQNTLAKDVKIGGLNLAKDEIDRIFKICAAHQFSSLAVKPLPLSEALPPKKADIVAPVVEPTASSRLTEIITQSDQTGGYDLKRALASGQVKPLPAKSEAMGSSPKLDVTHEIEAPRTKLDLPVQKPSVAVVKAPETGVAIVPPKSLQVTKPLPRTSLFKKAASLVAGTHLVAPLAPKLAAQAAVSLAKPTLAPQSVVTAPKPVDRPVSQPIATLLKPQEKLAPQLKPVSPPPVKTTPIPAVTSAPLPSSPAASRVAPVSSPRPVMHDITPMPKVMGPIEELRFLELINFRRLGATPGEAVNKIFSKIKLLEKDGYDKMVAGVKAWRQSPVNRLYLHLGQEALVKGRPLKEILADRKKAGQDVLSEEEISVIIALNGKLVF